jgi:hypothetical protein|nr:MAG TPA: hypothetical protein [Caudoviricetes sp.]
MGKIGDLWVKLKLKSDEYKKGLDEAQSKTRSFSDKIKSLSVTAKAIWGAIGISAAKLAGDFIKSSQTIGDAWDKTMTRLTTKWQAVVAEFNRSLTGSGTESLGQQLARGFMGPIWGTLFGPNSKRAGLAGKALSEAKDAMTEIEYAFRLTMAQTGPKLHDLYLKMMNSALSASDREAAAKAYRREIEGIYAPRVKGIKEILDKTVQQYLVIGGMSPNKYSSEKVVDLIKMMGSDPAKVEREYSDFFAGYQSIGDDISGNLVNTMEAYYNATNEMNDILKRADRTAQSMEKTGLDDIIKKLGAAKDGMSDFRAQVAEEAEVMAADEEFQKMSDPLEEFERTHDEVLSNMTEKQRTFAELAQESYEKAARAAYDYAQEEQESMDMAQDAADTAMANLEDRMQKAEELNNMLSDSIASSISDSTQAFSDMLFGLDDADASAVLGALLQPFANMAKQLGEMLIVEGMGIAAFKESMKSLNPAVAIAAGAALVALGAALSSGIQALGKSGGSSAMSSSTGSSASTTNENISTEMTVYVKGKISGKDILLSGDNARSYYGR